MSWLENDYINIEMTNNLNNYQLLKYTTETFAQLMFFLKQERQWQNLTLKIGYFEYDDWSADIYCILKEGKILFKHKRKENKREWTHKTLTEQLIYAWGFEEINFDIYFNIINDYWKILNNKDKKLYDELYNDVHCEFW